MERWAVHLLASEVIWVVAVMTPIGVTVGSVFRFAVATVVEKDTCCQAEAVSFVKVAVAGSVPVLVHRLATQAPVLVLAR